MRMFEPHGSVGWLFAALALLSSPAAAELNDQTTLVLHAVKGSFGFCEIGDPCQEGAQVEVSPGEPQVIYVIARNYDQLAYLHLKVVGDYPGWIIYFVLDCPGGCIDCTLSTPLTAYFFINFPKCQVGGETLIVGRIFAMGTQGCIRVTQSEYPYGTIAQGCDQQITPVPEAHWGRICVGPGGIDTCEVPVAVTGETWGAIKAQYGR
jgi:hypothetical protein